MPCAQEKGVMKTPDKSLAGCGESKERRNVCLTSQGSWGNKLHKEGHKQKCKRAHESLAGADGAQKKVSDGRMWAASGRVHPEAGPVGGSGLARAGLCPPAPDQHPPPSSLSLTHT